MAINMQALLAAISPPGQVPGQTPGYGDGVIQRNTLPPVEGEEITVNGSAPRAPVVAEPSLNIPLEPLQAKPEQIQAMQPLEGLPKHKGLFGMKGTLRDVIGIIGDSLLVGSGGKAIYAPHKQQERIGDAMVGFAGSPKDQLAAIQRVAVHDQELAQRMLEKYNANQIAQDELEVRRTTSEANAGDKEAKRKKDARTYAAAVMNRVQNNPALLPQALEIIKVNTGYDPEDLGITPNMSPEALGLYAAGGMNVAQQELADYRGKALDQRSEYQDGMLSVAQQNAQSNRIRANRPPAGRAQPQPTDASMAAPLIQKMGRVGWEGLTKNEQQQLRSLGRSPDRGGKKNRFGGSPPPKKGGSPAPAAKGGWGSMTVRKN